MLERDPKRIGREAEVQRRKEIQDINLLREEIRIMFWENSMYWGRGNKMGYETEKEKMERFLNGLVSESEDLEEYFLGKDPRKTKYYKRNKGKWGN